MSNHTQPVPGFNALRRALNEAGAIARSLVASRKGTIGIAAALLFVPVVMVTGAAVDYARLEQFKTQLQATVDSAALSGAAAYVTATDNSNAQTVAANYMTSNENVLPSHIGSITSSASATQVATGSSQGYTVTVNATATIGTTFMRLVEPTMTVSAKATAVNPLVTITLTTAGWKSSAGDGNTLYYWLLSGNNTSTIPNPNDFTTSQKLASNIPGNSSNTAVTITVTSTQQIGIALKNITADLGDYGVNYDCTSYQTVPTTTTYTTTRVYDQQTRSYENVTTPTTTYGSCKNSTQWFFSNVMPPSNNYYDTTANNSDDTGYASMTQNCSLITTMGSSIPTDLTPPSGTTGYCYSSLPTNSVFSCSALNGQYVTFYWNDMGGYPDDKDYNDAEISISCAGISGSGNSATSVYLSS